MKKKLTKLFFNFKTYLFAGVVCLFLAPILEYKYGVGKSLLFAKYAFFLLLIATLLLLINEFIKAHPAVKNYLSRVFKKIWRYSKKIGS